VTSWLNNTLFELGVASWKNTWIEARVAIERILG